MEPERRPDAEEEDQDESATSVAHVPEALLQSLRHPDRAPVTARPPAPVEGDEDDSSTLVSADARRVPMHHSGPASAAVPKVPPPPAVPRPATKSQIDRFEAETAGSPDEDPSDTAMGAKIPQSVMRHLSQRPPPPPAGPMFEPPPPEMFDPPPPDPLSAMATAPAARVAPMAKTGSQSWIVLAIAAAFLLALMAAAGGAYVYFFVLKR